MEMMKTILKNVSSVALLVLPSLGWAQSTSSVMIPISNQILEKLAGDDMARINLIKEVKKANPSLNAVPNLEIQMLRVEAKSGVGGAQIFLRVNNEMMDSRVVETNPDQLNSGDPLSFEKFELKNIDRAVVSEASLVIQAFSNIRIRSIEVVLGAVQEPVIFGHYADAQIAQVGGAVTASQTEGNSALVRPSPETVNAIYDRYYLGNSAAAVLGGANQSVNGGAGQVVVAQPFARPPVVAVPTPQPAPPVVQPQVVAPKVVVVQQPARPVAPTPACVRNSKGVNVCVGDTVKNTWSFPGKVVSVNPSTREVGVQFDFMGGAITVRDVDTYIK